MYKDKFRRKNVLFNPDDKDDMKLLQELSRLPYGEFSRRTKELWKEYLRREKK